LIVLAAFPPGAIAASNPRDVTFVLAAPDKPGGYRVGERIQINCAFAARSAGYCFVDSGGGVRKRSSRESVVDFQVEMATGAQAGQGIAYNPYFDEQEFDPDLIIDFGGLSSTGPLTRRLTRSTWF
jgi:hypothetical protein